MSKYMTKYIAVSESDIKSGSKSPEQLTLVKEKDHFLFDPRVFKPYRENHVLRIMEFGIEKNVNAVALKHPTKKGKFILAVYDGRQSVINTTEANLRLKSEGKTEKKIPVRVRKVTGTEEEIKIQVERLMVITNEHRQSDDPVTKGEKAQRLLNGGKSMEDVMIDFDVESEQSITNWTNLLKLNAKVREMVRTGKLAMTKALKLLKLPKEEQLEAAKNIINKTPKKKGGKKPHKGVDRRTINRIHELGAHTKNPTVKLVLDWIVGEKTDKAMAKYIDFSALKPAPKKKKSKKKATKKKATKKKAKRHPSWDRAEAKKKAAAKKKTTKKKATKKKRPSRKKTTA
jgi:hypothetical protein